MNPEAVMSRRVLFIDNNGIGKLGHTDARARLAANLRSTGREFWPTTMNVAEAMKSRDKRIRTRLLRSLHALAGENHALTLPTEALKHIASAQMTGADTIDFSEPGATAYFRDPESVTEQDCALAREHLIEQERGFRSVHERAKAELPPELVSRSAREKWPTMRDFLDQAWTTPEHLEGYLVALWESWGFSGKAPVEALVAHPAWRLYFDGWGAAHYGRNVAHPQLPWVETADLQQLVYLGISHDGLLATDDIGLQLAGEAILPRRYTMRRVVSVEAVTG